MIKDPVQEYVDWLKEMAVTLNTNLEMVKAWMSSQKMQNELFFNNIKKLSEDIKQIKEELKNDN